MTTYTTLDAMHDRGVKLVLIDADDLYVVFDNGVTVPIIGLWDDFGEAVKHIADAVVCEFGNDEVGYGTVLLDDGVEPVTFH